MINASNRARASALLSLALVAAIGAAGFSTGCEKKGPAETAGEKVDKAAKKTGEAVEKAGEKVQDAAGGH